MTVWHLIAPDWCHVNKLNFNANKILSFADYKQQVSVIVKRLKGPGQPPPFSMTSKLLIKHGEANSYRFTVSFVPEGMFNYLD